MVLTGKLATNDVDVKFVMRVMREKAERESKVINGGDNRRDPRIEHTSTAERRMGVADDWNDMQKALDPSRHS